MYALILLAIVVGMLLPIQAGVNAQLRQALGDPVMAACVSFTVGTAALLLTLAVTRPPLPAMAAVTRVPWGSWIGGVLGAVYVGMAVVLAPRLGAATLTAAVVAGQMLVSIALDHYGWVGFPEQPANLTRVAGAALVVAGVLLIQK